MPERNVGVCGLDCGQCPANLAMVNDDQELREKTAVEWNEVYAAFGADFKPADINCAGCRRDGPHSGYCGHCPIRTCAIRRDQPDCHVCPDFSACDVRKEFESHGLDIAKNFSELA